MSFFHGFKPGTYENSAKETNDADIIIPLIDQNKPALDLIRACFTHAAKLCKPSVTPDEMGSRERKIVERPLDVVADGNGKKIHNDGHMVIRTTNYFNDPMVYVTTAGVSIIPRLKDKPADGYDIFEPVMDPNGLEASKLVGTGNNVRVKIAMRAGQDRSKTKAKVKVSIVAIQFLAEDEQLSGSPEADTSEFGAVTPPAGDGFETADQVEALAADPFGDTEASDDPFA